MKKIIVLLCFVAMLFGRWDTADAIPLQDLFGGAELTTNNLRYYNWQLLFLDSSEPEYDPDLSQIEVTGLEDQPFNPGLNFEVNGELVIENPINFFDYIDLSFGFNVATLNGQPLIKDNSLVLTGYSFDSLNFGGSIYIYEWISDPAGNPLGEKVVYADYLMADFKLFDSAEFNPQATIYVEKNILVSTDDLFDSVSLDSFGQRFSQNPIPEPSSMLLLGTGLLCIAGIRRKNS